VEGVESYDIDKKMMGQELLDMVKFIPALQLFLVV
jgi:hypothetical protein